MEKFFGKFMILPERTTGFKECAEAMKLSKEAVGLIATCKNMIIALERRGDVIWDFTDFGEVQEEFVFKLGEPTSSKTWGYDVKSVFKLDGEVLRGEHDFAGTKTTSARYYEGDMLVFEMTAKGATAKTYYQRLSKLMEKFLGRFRYLPEKTTGFDKWADAMKLSPEARGLIKSCRNMLIALERRGDVYWDFTDYGEAKEEFVFRLGEPVVSKSIGSDMKSVFKLDGEVLRGEHDIGGFKTSSARYYDGDFLVFELTAGEATTKGYYLRESQIMDKFLGKFRFLPEKLTGFDNWADVMKLSPEARGLIKTCKNMLIAVERRGDVYWDFTDFGVVTEEFVFRLGEPVTSKTWGYDVTSVFKLDGEVLRGEHDFGGFKTTSARYYEGDTLVFEMTASGVTTKSYYLRESQIMDKFLGKFQFLPERMTGFDKWADVMKLSPEARGLIKTCKNMLIAVERRGDVYWDFTDFGVAKEEFVFRLGEPTMSKTWGYDVKSVFKLDGDVLRGEHDLGGFKTTSARYYEGDTLVFEMTAGDATTRSFYQRPEKLMEKFFGRFKYLPEKTTGFDQYADAMKLSQEARGLVKNSKDVVTELQQRGDVIWDLADYGAAKEEFVFRLGEPVMTKTWGYDVKNVYWLDGDVLRGEHDFGAMKTSSARYLQGDIAVFEATANGATMKSFFKRM